MKKYFGSMTGLLAMASMGMSSGIFESGDTLRSGPYHKKRKSELTPTQKKERLRAKRARIARRINR